MPPARKSADKSGSPGEPSRRQLRLPTVPLNAEMACDTAFRLVTRRCLEDLIANHPPTCRGNAAALHRMRIAVTRLRTAILFFSPMVADPECGRIQDELKWLNAHLGAVRDLDVAIERLSAIGKESPLANSYYRSWNAKRRSGHQHLTRALRSTRYRRLIERLSGWIKAGSWSVRSGKRAAKDRACPIAEYSAGKLARWEKKLLGKCGGLAGMGTKKRHRLRLLNKKISYSIAFFEDLFADRRFTAQRAALKHLRKAQRCLGRLNDDANGHALATALHRDGVEAPLQFLSAKREKRLLRAAIAAYGKLDTLNV